MEERIRFLKLITQDYAEKIEIAQVDGLLVDFAEDNDVDFLVSEYALLSP